MSIYTSKVSLVMDPDFTHNIGVGLHPDHDYVSKYSPRPTCKLSILLYINLSEVLDISAYTLFTVKDSFLTLCQLCLQ